MLGDREQLVRRLQRRRRVRLMAVCVTTAVLGGAIASILAPDVLVGGMSAKAPADPAQSAAGGPMAKGLAETLDRIALDAGEARDNRMRWASFSKDEKRAYLDRYWELAELDSERRAELMERYEAFHALPPAERDALRERARRLREFLASLSPQDQAVLRGMDDEERARRVLELWTARYGTW
jgi:hypothetical protein